MTGAGMQARVEILDDGDTVGALRVTFRRRPRDYAGAYAAALTIAHVAELVLQTMVDAAAHGADGGLRRGR